MSDAPGPFQAAIEAAARAVGPFPGVRLVVLFGSVARGTSGHDSDADVGVDGGGFWEQLSVATAVAQALHREADPVDLGHASDWLRYQVARDGVLLFAHTPEDWHQFRASAMVRYFDLAPLIARCAEGVRRRLAREAAARG